MLDYSLSFHKKHHEELVSLYMYTKQYDKALALIKLLDEEVGASTERDAYKRQIFTDSKYREAEKDFLVSQIKKNPKIESNYISLIYLYSESNQEEKAFEVAKQLETNLSEFLGMPWDRVGGPATATLAFAWPREPHRSQSGSTSSRARRARRRSARCATGTLPESQCGFSRCPAPLS